MKRRFALPFLLAVTAVQSGCKVEDGSGQISSQTRPIEAASYVTVCCGFEVEFSQANEPSARVITDDNLVDEVVLENFADKLSIFWAGKTTTYNPTQPVRVELSLPNLRRFDGSGGMVLESGDLDTDDLQLNFSGGSKATFAELRANVVELDASGGSEVSIAVLLADSLAHDSSGGSQLEASGICPTLDTNVSGGGQLLLADLVVEDAAISLSGGSRAELQVTKRLEGAVSGGGEITLWGAPTIDVDISDGDLIQK